MEGDIKQIVDKRIDEKSKMLLNFTKWAIGIFMMTSVSILGIGIYLVRDVLVDYRNGLRAVQETQSIQGSKSKDFQEDFGYAMEELDRRFDGGVFNVLAHKYQNK